MKVVLYGSPVIDRKEWLASELGDDHEIVAVDYTAAPEVKQAAFKGARAVIAVRYDLPRPVADGLEIVQVPGIGCDEVDLELVPPGAAVCNVRGHDAGVSEYVILQMLEWCHGAGKAAEELRAGSWKDSSRFGAKPHRELRGSVVGIVGYGGIGRALSARLSVLGVRVLVANRRIPEDRSGVDHCFGLDRIEAMFRHCDFGVVALALTNETRGLIAERELIALGGEGVLVNVARAHIVDEDALWSCLSQRRLGGAIFDVWYRYPDDPERASPPSRYPLLDLSNVVATPHIAGWTAGTVEERWADIVENMRRIGSGRPLINVVRAPTHAMQSSDLGHRHIRPEH